MAVTFCFGCSSESGRDNPFRPDGDISREADEIVQLIKSGKPLLDTSAESGTAPANSEAAPASAAGSPTHSAVREPLLQESSGNAQLKGESKVFGESNFMVS